MIKDRIQWENVPEDMMEKWLSAYHLVTWPFKEGDRHDMNRDKIERIYSEINRCRMVPEGKENKDIDAPDKGRLPKDANLKTLYDILHKARCAVFNDAKMEKNINDKDTTEYKTCEIAVRNINRFIEAL